MPFLTINTVGPTLMQYGTDAQRESFYTALMRIQQFPNLHSDVDGRYRGPDDQVHKAEGFTFHSTFSLWDTFRAEHPLLLLVQPERRNADFVNSLLASQKASPFGILPVWQFHGRETWTMIGYHAVPVIADAYLKGVRGFDENAALDAMVKSASYGPYGGLEQYMKLGYAAIDKEPEAASKTVEYAYDDWTIARMARALGKDDIAATFEKRAGNWRNSFDAKTGFLRARKTDGSFRTPFDPTAINYGSDYTEGNAWQYSWFVPQDQAAMFALLGGDKAAVKKLDAQMARLRAARGETVREPVAVDYARSFFPVLLIVLIIRSFLFEPFRIPSTSMAPTRTARAPSARSHWVRAQSSSATALRCSTCPITSPPMRLMCVPFSMNLVLTL